MKGKDLTRPDLLLWNGLKNLNPLKTGLYSDTKSASKAQAKLTFIGEKRMTKVESQLYRYNKDYHDKQESPMDFSFFKQPEENKYYWLNFHGVHEVTVLQKIGTAAQLDRMTLRHILDTTQRPKIEDYEHYLFFSVKSILKDTGEELRVEQLSFVLGPQYVISFQEEVGDHFDGIRGKMQEGIGLIRKKKSDFLLAQMLDAILDNYFETIDHINSEVTLFETQILKNPSPDTLVILEKQKRTAQVIKKSLGPFKEALVKILNGQNNWIEEINMKYYRDLVHSATAAVEEIESTQKTLEGLTNIYFSSLSQKMNETMKVLTTVATIFIPLTFIAGIYGMNFDYIPELKYRNGYFVTWGIMLSIALAMILYFKRKKWI